MKHRDKQGQCSAEASGLVDVPLQVLSRLCTATWHHLHLYRWRFFWWEIIVSDPEWCVLLCVCHHTLASHGHPQQIPDNHMEQQVHLRGKITDAIAGNQHQLTSRCQDCAVGSVCSADCLVAFMSNRMLAWTAATQLTMGSSPVSLLLTHPMMSQASAVGCCHCSCPCYSYLDAAECCVLYCAPAPHLQPLV